MNFDWKDTTTRKRADDLDLIFETDIDHHVVESTITRGGVMHGWSTVQTLSSRYTRCPWKTVPEADRERWTALLERIHAAELALALLPDDLQAIACERLAHKPRWPRAGDDATTIPDEIRAAIAAAKATPNESDPDV